MLYSFSRFNYLGNRYYLRTKQQDMNSNMYTTIKNIDLSTDSTSFCYNDCIVIIVAAH